MKLTAVGIDLTKNVFRPVACSGGRPRSRSPSAVSAQKTPPRCPPARSAPGWPPRPRPPGVWRRVGAVRRSGSSSRDLGAAPPARRPGEQKEGAIAHVTQRVVAGREEGVQRSLVSACCLCGVTPRRAYARRVLASNSRTASSAHGLATPASWCVLDGTEMRCATGRAEPGLVTAVDEVLVDVLRHLSAQGTRRGAFGMVHDETNSFYLT